RWQTSNLLAAPAGSGAATVNPATAATSAPRTTPVSHRHVYFVNLKLARYVEPSANFTTLEAREHECEPLAPVVSVSPLAPPDARRPSTAQGSLLHLGFDHSQWYCDR